ncbi:MAG: BatD family protein [Planctomycetes bacterium]|nr:BatD family protein [Planctomycetota bacterium]MBL7037279.1 BatD family protein [Pirellulaceae bacterium]
MKSLILFGCLLVSSSAVAADGEPELLVQLSQDRIYEGESVLYRVTLVNVENPSPPKLKGFDDFEVQSRGAQSLDSQEIRVDENGGMTRIVQYRRAYDFLLTPKRSGELTIPAPTAEVMGKVLRGQAVTLQVVAPEDQDLAILEVAVDKETVYPMQPFTVKVNVAVKALPGPLADRDPVAVLAALSGGGSSPMSVFFDRRGVEPPALSFPWVDDGKLPTGLEPIQPVRRWLGNLLNRRGEGFSINGLLIFRASLFDESPNTFVSEARKTRRNDKSGQSVDYWEYSFQREFVAKQVGEYSFGPATLKARFIAQVNTRGEAELERVYAIAKPIAVTVRDIPLDGRPASYNGAIGQFQIESQLAPTKAKVGDPMTLTLTVRGKGTLDALTTPRLEDISEVADHFRIHEGTEESDDEMRRFTYSLRPLDAGIERFPPVEMSYFDVDREEYVTLKTAEIPVEVGIAEELSSTEIAMANASPSGARDVEIQKGGLMANHTLTSLRDDSVDPYRWFAGLGSLAGVYVIVVLVTQKARRLMGDPALVRRRAAATRARGRLREARRRHADAAEEADSLRAAIVGLIADVAGIDEAGLTTGDVRERLLEMGADESIVERLTAWCEACDAARYGAGAAALHGLEDESGTLLDELITIFKRKRVLK